VTEFSEYRRVGALMLPARRRVRTQRDVLLDVRAERLTVDEPLDEGCIDIPTGFTTQARSARQPVR
jgi:hypothetical protein